MSKNYKVRRYGYDRRQQKKQHVVKLFLMLGIIVGACVAGWFLYEPGSAWVQNIVAEQQLKKQQAAEEKPQEQPGDPNGGQETPTTPETPGEEAAAFPQKSYTLTAAQLRDAGAFESLLQSLAAQGYDGVVFDLKDADGQVLYQSAVEAVTANKTQTAARYDLAAVLGAIDKAGLTPVGRLFTFRDKTASRQIYDAAVKYNYTGTNWVDNDVSAGGKSWLNPNSAEAQEYILALLKEATDAGLRQIILDGAQFPEGYSLNLATYAEKGAAVDKTAVLSAFIRKAKQQGEAAGCTIWTNLCVGATAGVNTVRYGTDLSTLLTAAGNVIIDVSPEQFGVGITTEQLTLQKPVQDPYGTVKAALAASPALKAEGLTLAAWVQGYTSATVAGQSNLTYTAEQIESQIKATQEFGIAYYIVDSFA